MAQTDFARYSASGRYRFTPLEYYKYWNEIEKQFHDEDHDRLRERSVLQRSLIRAYEKLHAERMAQFEKEETEQRACAREVRQKQLDRFAQVCKRSLERDRLRRKGLLPPSTGSDFSSRRSRPPATAATDSFQSTSSHEAEPVQLHTESLALPQESEPSAPAPLTSETQPPTEGEVTERRRTVRIAEQDDEHDEDEEEHDEEPEAAAEEVPGAEGEEGDEALAEQEAAQAPARVVTRGGGGGGSVEEHEHERVPSTIPEEVSAPLTESASLVLDGQHAEAEAEGRGRDDDLSILPAYQAYLYVLLGAAVAREYLHPRATASAVGKKIGAKTDAELAIEREHKRILQNSEVRQKGREGVESLWNHFRQRTSLRLQNIDHRIPAEQKEAYRAFMLESLKRRHQLPVRRSYTAVDDLPEAERLLENRRELLAHAHRRLAQLMYRMSESNRERFSRLLHAHYGNQPSTSLLISHPISAPKTPEQVEELYALARVLEREESGLDLTPGERSLVSRLLAELDLENLSGLRHSAPPRALSDLVPQVEARATATDRERTASSSYWAEFVQQQQQQQEELSPPNEESHTSYVDGGGGEARAPEPARSGPPLLLPGIAGLRFMTASAIAAESVARDEHKFGSFAYPSASSQRQSEKEKPHASASASAPVSAPASSATSGSGSGSPTPRTPHASASSAIACAGSASAGRRKSKSRSRQLSLSRTLLANQWRSSQASSLAHAVSVSARAPAPEWRREWRAERSSFGELSVNALLEQPRAPIRLLTPLHVRLDADNLNLNLHHNADGSANAKTKASTTAAATGDGDGDAKGESSTASGPAFTAPGFRFRQGAAPTWFARTSRL